MPAPEQWATSAAGERRGRLRRSPATAFAAGGLVGVLGGMIGLGGAEFRLPLLIGLFGFVALEAVVVNTAGSVVGALLLGVVPNLLLIPALALLLLLSAVKLWRHQALTTADGDQFRSRGGSA